MKICVITGTRAEYGLLQPVMKGIVAEPTLELCLFVCGMHLSPIFGETYREIEADGFLIDEKIDMSVDGGTPISIVKSMGIGTGQFAEALDKHKPDMVMLLGDRFELLAAAQAAHVLNIPIAHISGGDSTEGAIDEAFRHSITKMSHLHFVTNDVAAKRVRQLGENPKYIIQSGNPGLDHLKSMKLLDRAEFEKAIDFKLRSKNLIITFHPVTLETTSAAAQLSKLLEALHRLGEEVGLIFTMPNADPQGQSLIGMINDFVSKHPNSVAHMSLGQLRYLSALSHVDAIVGNSSSGLTEAPSFRIATVNVGDRQKGRLEAASVITVPMETEAIFTGIESALVLDCSQVVNPYGDGSATQRIITTLKGIKSPRALMKKHFFDL